MTGTDPAAPSLSDHADLAARFGLPAATAAVLEIDLAAIADNWRACRALHGGRPTAAVLKADAYGTGAARVGPALHAAGCRHFFTAHLDEAVALRKLLPGSLLAPLNGLLPGSEATYLAEGIIPVLSDAGEARCWAALARREGRALPAILHIDTGIARRGIPAAEAAALWSDPDIAGGVALRYVASHFAAADVAEDPCNLAQLGRFQAACATLPAAPTSLANSAALFLGPEFRSDLARPGAALYGVTPEETQPNAIRQALRLRARVLQVREVGAGEPVGYNATWIAPRPSRIAVVGVGYADGWPRALSNRGEAGFDGATLPLVGRVSMDLTTFDATELPHLRPGDWLELIGPGRSVERIAAQAGASPYEILTGLGRRYARVWRE